MGCPNLPVDPSNPDGERGCMFITVRGQGAFQVRRRGALLFLATLVLPLDLPYNGVPRGGESQPTSWGLSPGNNAQRKISESEEIAIRMSPISKVSEAVFCESVEAGHSSHNDAAEIARALGITRVPVRMDSQCKYGTIARGAADIYLRLPVRKDYEENIWVRVCFFFRYLLCFHLRWAQTELMSCIFPGGFSFTGSCSRCIAGTRSRRDRLGRHRKAA